MNRDGITTFLNVLLAISLLASVILCGVYVQQTRAYRQDSAKAAVIRDWQNLLRAFAVDCVAYGKTNPDLVPILDTVGWAGTKPAAPAAPAASAKPAGK